MTVWQTLSLLEMLPQLKSAEHKCCDRQDQTIALSKVGILQTRSTVWRLSPPQTRATSPRTSSSSSSSCRCWWRWWQYSCWPSISTAARPNTPPVRWAPPRCFVTVNCWTTSWTTGRPVPRHLTAPWPRPLLTQPPPCLPPATPSWGHAQHEVFLLPPPSSPFSVSRSFYLLKLENLAILESSNVTKGMSLISHIYKSIWKAEIKKVLSIRK